MSSHSMLSRVRDIILECVFFQFDFELVVNRECTHWAQGLIDVLVLSYTDSGPFDS